MNVNILNKTEFNLYGITNKSSRSGNALQLDGKINHLNVISKSLNSKTQEVGKIISSKDNPINLDNQPSSSKSILKNNNILTRLLINEETNKALISLSYLNPINKAKIFNVGGKSINSNLFKSLVQSLNIEKSNIKNIRHYLNLLTKFEFKLANSNLSLYKFDKTNQYIFAMQKATDLLNISFNSKGCFISKPSFNLIHTNKKIEEEINNNANLKAPKVIINLFYYVKTTEQITETLILENKAKVLTDQYESKFANLTDYLTKLFNAEVELNLVRLYQPYQDPTILVQFLNSESYNNKFIKLVSNLFKNVNVYNKNEQSNIVADSNLSLNNSKNSFSFPSNISGVNIKLAGRALNERVIPRLTVKRAQRGSFNRLNAKLIEKSMFTDKTRKGSFSFTVILGQNFK